MSLEPPERYTTVVPRDRSARVELLAERPPAWEYLLFASALQAGIQRAEPKWRDFRLGYSMQSGREVSNSELAGALREMFSRLIAIVGNAERIISEEAQLLSFGAPGEPGDAELIEHTALRLSEMYESLLDWSAEIRAMRVSDEAREAREVAARLVAQPIAATRMFANDMVRDLEASLTARAAGDDAPISIILPLTFELNDSETQRLIEAVARLER